MKHLLALLALALVVFAPAGPRARSAAASRGGSYTLEWSAIGGGGGTASGGTYTIVSSIGQAEAGAASSGSYLLVGGFVGGVEVVAPPTTSTPNAPVYVPLVRR